MDSSNPYHSTNPWTLARYLRNSCSVCPRCRRKCGFDIEVDRNEELIHMSSDCPDCGKIVLVPFIEDNSDLGIYIGETEDYYEPVQECFELSESVKGTDIITAAEEQLSAFSKIAACYADSKRRQKAIEMGCEIAKAYQAKTDSRESKDLCLAQVSATASVMVDSSENHRALDLFNEYLPLTEGNESGKSFAFLLARAFSLFSEDDMKEATASVRNVIASLDRMKSENRIPADDPFIRSRAYEALGFLLSAKNDKTGSMKAMKKALEDSREVLSKNTTDDGLRWMNRCSREYAFACFQADMKKRSMEALKDSIKICAANRETFPWAYAESLLERGMFISDSGLDIPPYLRKDMDEAIEILSKPDDSGKYDPLLPVAYYYRSMTGIDKEKLDEEDLEKAYSIIREGVKKGEVPDSVLTSVVDTYATYLDVNNEEKAKQVRTELAEMGIWVHPPVKKKSE